MVDQHDIASLQQHQAPASYARCLDHELPQLKRTDDQMTYKGFGQLIHYGKYVLSWFGPKPSSMSAHPDIFVVGR